MSIANRAQMASAVGPRQVSTLGFFITGFHWKKGQEEQYPVENRKAAVMLPSAADDTAAAIAGAGGGRGLVEETD